MIIYVLALGLFSGCKKQSSGSQVDDGLNFIESCTMVGSSNGLSVEIISAAPLPANLALAFNGDTINADECSSSNLYFESSIEISADRLKAKISLNMDGYFKLRQQYLPDLSKPPQSNVIDISFYNRTQCEDTSIKFHEITAAQLVWKPIYANGENCGVSSYQGASEIQLN